MARLVPTGVVTVTYPDPDPDGEHAVSEFELVTWTFDAAKTRLDWGSTMTCTLVTPLRNPVPVMVMGVVEHVGPEAVTDVTVGGVAPKTQLSIVIALPHVVVHCTTPMLLLDDE